MTPRERVLTVLNRKKADQVPWFGDLDYWATSLITRGEKPEDFKRSDAYLQWHRDLRCGFYLQGYFPFKEIIENCDVRTWNEGRKRYREITTPEGTLRECWRYLDISYSEGHEEYLLKSEEDLPAYNFMIENTRYEPDYDFALLRRKQVGEMGVVLVYTPRSPFMHLLALDAGIMTIAYISSSAPEAFAETIGLMRKKFTEAAAIAAASPSEIVMTPENLSAEMVGPKYFDRYMKDCQTEWSDMIQAAGKFSCIHMDGTLKGLLREECGIGLSFIEACTPAPVGDLAVGDWASYMKGSETILWGGIPGIYFTEKVTDGEFDRFVREILSVMRGEPRYVLGVADQVPPDGLAGRVRRVADLVDEYGNY
ncbi:MAG: hypothetical protein E4H36_07105 [Spirochaetales bacterium]|nr:MAG: hypothetical protein E4H36_07105 [Spirochaetales bacterium]